MLILLLARADAGPQKEGCKTNLVRTFGSGGSKVVFTLLTEIITV